MRTWVQVLAAVEKHAGKKIQRMAACYGLKSSLQSQGKKGRVLVVVRSAAACLLAHSTTAPI